MTDADHVRDLLAAVRAAPEDWPLRLVLADALDDAGRHEDAVGQRWQAGHRRRPRGSECQWYDGTNATGIDEESDLPGPLFALLLGGTFVPSSYQNYRSYLSHEDAEADLAQALTSLKGGDRE